MSKNLSLLLTTALGVNQSVTELNAALKTIEKKLTPLTLNIDEKTLKALTNLSKELSETYYVTTVAINEQTKAFHQSNTSGIQAITTSMLTLDAALATLHQGLTYVVEKAKLLQVEVGKIAETTASSLIDVEVPTNDLASAILQISEATEKSQTATTDLGSDIEKISIYTSIITTVLGSSWTEMATKFASSGRIISSAGALITTSLRMIAASIPAVGIITAIGFAIEKLFSIFSEAKQKQAEFAEKQNDSITTYKNSSETIEQLIAQYKELDKIKGSSGLNLSREKEYLQLQTELVQLLPALTHTLNENGQIQLLSAEFLEKEIELLKEKIELGKEAARLEAPKTIKTLEEDIQSLNTKKEYAENNLQSIDGTILSDHHKNKLKLQDKTHLLQLEGELFLKTKQLHEQYKLLYDTQNLLTNSDITFLQGMSDGTKAAGDNLSVLATALSIVREVSGDLYSTEEIAQFNEQQQAVFNSLSAALANGVTEWENWRQAIDFYGLDSDNIISQLIEKTRELTEEQVKMQSTIDIGIYKDMGATLPITTLEELEKLNKQNILLWNEHGQAVNEFGEVTNEAVSKTKALVNTFNEAVSSIQSLNGFINELNDNHHLSAKSIATIMEKYPELLTYMNDEKALIEQIKTQIQEEEKIAKRAIYNKVKDNEEFFNIILQGNKEFYTYMEDNYGKDFKNYRSLAEAKEKIEADLIGKLAKKWGQYYDVQADELTAAGRRLALSTLYSGNYTGTEEQDRKKYREMMADIEEYKKELQDISNRFENIVLDSSTFNVGKVNLNHSSSSGANQTDKKNHFDSLIQEINSNHQLTKSQNEQINTQLDLAKTQNDYNKHLSLSNSLLEGQKKQINDLRYANERLHRTANQIRNNQPQFDTSSWFDADNNETSEFIRQYNSASKAQQEQMAETFTRLQKLKNAYMENTGAIQELNKAMIDTRFERDQVQIERFTALMDGVDRSIKKTKLTREQYEQGSAEWINSIQEETAHLQYKQKIYEREAEEIKKILQNTQLTRQEIDHWTKALSDNTLAQLDNMNVISRIKEDFANNIIDVYKEAYRKQQQIMQAGINEQVRILEEAHKKKMAMLDEEYKKFENTINQQLRLLDDQSNEDNFQKRLSQLQQEELALRQEINKRSLDDSSESKVEILKLEEELHKKTEEIETLKQNRSNDLRKQNLRDQLEEKRKEIQAEKEKSQYIIEINGKQFRGTFEEAKFWIDEQKKYWDRYYENLIQDEQHWQLIRSQLMNGHVDHLVNEFERLKNEIAPYMATIGESITKNLLVKLSNAQELLNSFHQSSAGSSSSIPTVTAKMQANSQEWHSASISRRKELEAENQRLGASIDAIYNSTEGKWYRDGKLLYHQGGIVGGNSSRLGELVNKLMNSNADEVTIKALRGELLSPQHNLQRFFLPNTQKLVANVAGGLTQGSKLVIEKLLHIDKIENGSNIDIEKLVNKTNDLFIQKLRTYGLIR